MSDHKAALSNGLGAIKAGVTTQPSPLLSAILSPGTESPGDRPPEGGRRRIAAALLIVLAAAPLLPGPAREIEGPLLARVARLLDMGDAIPAAALRLFDFVGYSPFSLRALATAFAIATFFLLARMPGASRGFPLLVLAAFPPILAAAGRATLAAYVMFVTSLLLAVVPSFLRSGRPGALLGVAAATALACDATASLIPVALLLPILAARRRCVPEALVCLVTVAAVVILHARLSGSGLPTLRSPLTSAAGTFGGLSAITNTAPGARPGSAADVALPLVIAAVFLLAVLAAAFRSAAGLVAFLALGVLPAAAQLLLASPAGMLIPILAPAIPGLAVLAAESARRHGTGRRVRAVLGATCAISLLLPVSAFLRPHRDDLRAVEVLDWVRSQAGPADVLLLDGPGAPALLYEARTGRDPGARTVILGDGAEREATLRALLASSTPRVFVHGARGDVTAALAPAFGEVLAGLVPVPRTTVHLRR